MARRTPQFPKKDDYYFIDRKINGERCHLRSKDPYELEAKYQAWLIAREKREEERQRGGYFEDVAALWWAEKEKTIKNGTRICYKPAYARAKEYFCGQRMGEITPDQVAQYIGGLQRKGYAGNTIANHKSVLMMIFDYWRYDPRWKGAKPNPVTGYKLPAGLPKQERQPPTAEQIAICKANMSHPFGHLIALLIYTGARLNEINALQWKDIDYTTRHIKIYKSVAWVGNRPVIGTPKTKTQCEPFPCSRRSLTF